MECISIFDMLKIGVGPSSSHTLGPWRAAERWLLELSEQTHLSTISQVKVRIYGSLSLTGKGHATDYALILGLSGYDPVQIPTEEIPAAIAAVKANKSLQLNGVYPIVFDPNVDLVFEKDFLPFHANGMEFHATTANGQQFSEVYYSIGGGFVVKEALLNAKENEVQFNNFPYPIEKGTQLLHYCKASGKPISEIVLANEQSLRTDAEIDTQIQAVWQTMLSCMYEGCHTEGTLPGGLEVRRRAFDLHKNLIKERHYTNAEDWMGEIRKTDVKFRDILKWVSCFALAVNEVNASLGRVVTAPTNGSAGVIPSVLMYYLVIENHQGSFEEIKRFLLVAGEIGSIFKKGATISAAMGGCQAEIGVSSAMAAAALTELLGGSPEQVLIAAEIAMEHHLGLTCDPIGGLVQIPCIERNSMGAIKAINAAELALNASPENTKIPLDKVVNTMWETAKDMSSKYKETSTGGLAVGVFLSDC